MPVQTNAHAQMGALAAAISNTRRGQFVSVINQLKGETKGGQKYGDALVHDVMVSGFGYMKLVARDLAVLERIDENTCRIIARMEGKVTAWEGRGKNARQTVVTADDYIAAWHALTESRKRTLAGTNKATHDGAFEPLEVSGERVPGCHVYVGDNDKIAAGTIYLRGLRVGRTVLEAPANGYWTPKSNPRTVAKKVLAKALDLPSRRYTTHVLAPDGGYVLNLGSDAAVAVQNGGITLDPKMVAHVRDGFLKVV